MASVIESETAEASAPVVRAGILSRRQLFERLAGAGRVTQISAPTGSGKTFLLRSWIAETGLAGQVAWVPVPRGERDPQRFWLSVADALRGTAAGAGLVRPLTAGPDLDGWAIVERLLKDLAGLRDRIWLVIDDLHELGPAEVLDQLELLVMRAPDRLRFVLAARHDLRLGLHRLRLEGELTELRAADLRFTREETRALLAAAGVQLPEAALALLQARTEGWVAGLRLAALSLAGHPDPERFAAEFCGSERTVAEYLLAEVLERQSEPVRRLLLRTSVLERVNGELAALLTGAAGGERILQDLEAAGAFVVALDARRSWFRYHPLFADLLQLQLRCTAPEELPALHAAAAGWFAEHGHPAEAIRHAQAAEDWDLAADLLAKHWVNLYLGGQTATTRELLARFPAGTVAADAELTVLQAVGQLTRGSLQEAERNLAVATRQSGSLPADRRGRFQVILTISRLLVARQCNNLPAVAEEADRLLAAVEAADAAQLGLSEELRALAVINLGIAEAWAGRPEDADRHLEEGATLARRIGQPYLELNGLVHWAAVAYFRSFTAGAQRSKQAIELAERHGWADDQVTGVAYTILAAALGAQGRVAEAEPCLERAAQTLRTETEPAAGLNFHFARWVLDIACGRYQEALADIQAAERLAGTLVTPHTLLLPVRARVLRTLVRLGQTECAEAGLAGLDERERDSAEMRTALAQLRLAQHDARAAVTALAPVLDGSVPVSRPLWMVTALLLEATARDALGDPAAAGRALERALDAAAPDRVLLPFLVDPAPRLLERHARQATAHAALIDDILSLLAGRRQPAPPPEPGRLREPLSQAETRVLRYLPTNLTVPEIAAELSLSVNTVRTHMRHVYDKIGAHRRSRAVEQARTLGLLASPSPRN